MQGDLNCAHERASRQAASLRDPVASFRFRLLDAEALLALGQTADALKQLGNDLPKTPASALLEIQRQIDLADAWSRMRRVSDAFDLLSTAKASTGDRELLTRIAVLEGRLFARANKPVEAERALRRALELATPANDHYNEASALLNLSLISIRSARYDESLQYALRSLDLANQLRAKRIAAACQINIGTCYSRLGNFERSTTHLLDAIRLETEMGDRANLQLATGQLGNLHTLEGRPNLALEPYRRAYALANQLNSQEDSSRWAGNLANVAIESGDWAEAEKWNRIAGEIAEQLNDERRRMYVAMNAATIAAGTGKSDEAIRLYSQVIQKSGANSNLQWEAHSALGQTYAAANRPLDADREFAAAFAAIEQTRSSLDSNFKITLLSRLMRFYQSYVDILAERGDDAKAIQVVESSRARVLAEKLDRPPGAGSDLKRIRQLAAQSHAVFLSFWIAPKRSFAWLIDANGVHRFTLPPAAQIESLVTRYRGGIEEIARDTAPGAALWDALLAPIAPGIPARTRVIVIPDGPLHRVNLEALPVPGRRNWIDDAEVAVSPSLSVLTAGEAGPPRSLLAIGAPAAASPEYPPLPKAASELARIQSHFAGRQVSVRQAADAFPDAYRQASPDRYSLIHFAAHGESNGENPLESAVILSRNQDRYKLYARDVIDIPIHADLVTISACRSAGVRAYAGEGLIGFAWAFLQAGSHAVAAGLWDVSDSSTEPLMNHFYEKLSAGVDPINALRTAKLTLIAAEPRFRHPYYWAPFQIYVRALGN